MRQRNYLLIGYLMLSGVLACPVSAGIILRAGHTPSAQSVQVVSYLSDINKPLKDALLIHNLMNEMPMLRDTAKTAENLKDQTELMVKMQKKLTSCNVQKLGKVFKNPSNVWGKMNTSYEQKRQAVQKESEKQDPLTMTIAQRLEKDREGWTASRDILMDVYENPAKWGEVNKDAAFPLWKDQIALFEKQWNEFYDTLNAAYGVPLKGRPAVDEETRHNAQKYNEVLAAHKLYLAQISEGRRVSNADIIKKNPPKAPKGLPKWQDIVRIDQATGKAVPELPEPWREMSKDQFKNYVDGGEMAEFFNGKSLTPTAGALVNSKSDLESEYDMMLAVDALEKGTAGSMGAQAKMVEPFVQKLSELGIDTTNFDITNRGQYARVLKELKDKKKAAMEEAAKYINLLEEQDRTNPDLVAKRKQLNEQKRARMSAEAQSATTGMDGVIQISQMSPAAQQRLVLAALEKDSNASVHLTQTNAIEVDQLMREQRATNKIIAESYQQVNSALEQQREIIPQMPECSF